MPVSDPASLVEGSLIDTPTIFHEPWWLAIACDGGYRETSVVKDGTIIARLPFKYALRYKCVPSLQMPALSHVLGPVFAPQYASEGVRSLKKLIITRELIRQLPSAMYTSFRLHPGITDTLAFNEAGFRTEAAFTVVIKPAHTDVLWRNMRDKTRNVIRRARERHDVVESLDPADFLAFYRENLRDRGLKNRYEGRSYLALITAALKRGVGRLTVARDFLGTPQGAIFTAWDGNFAYYLMSTRARTAMNGVVNLLIWDAIQFAAVKNLSFDVNFLHVNKDSLPNYLLLTGFGGQIEARFQVTRSSPVIGVARELKNIWG